MPNETLDCCVRRRRLPKRDINDVALGLLIMTLLNHGMIAATAASGAASGAASAPSAARDYTEAALSPTLTRGLVELCRIRPDQPVKWLAHWLLANKPPPEAKPVTTVSLEFFEKVFGDEGETKFREMDVDANGFVTLDDWVDHYCQFNEADIRYKDPVRPYEELSDSSRRILFNLLGFVRCRQAVEMTALAVLPEAYMDQCASFSAADKSLLRQLRGDGTQIDSYDALIAHHEPVFPRFVTLMKHIVCGAGLDPSSVPMHRGEPLVEGFTVLTIAPFKGRERCDEKAANEYNGLYSCIIDCIRCSIIVETEAQLMSVANALGKACVPLELLTGDKGGGGFDACGSNKVR